MKLTTAKYEIIEQGSGIDGLEKQIEKAARTCYKSEAYIKEGSAKKMVDMLTKSGHGAMLEHGTVYLYFPNGGCGLGAVKLFDTCRLNVNKYTRSVDENYYTTNYRVLVENDMEWMLDYMCDPTEHHERRVTVKFTCDRVTGESFLRHRAIDEDHLTVEGAVTREQKRDIDSFARESTRYCNFSKDKFGKELTIIQPEEISSEDVTEVYAKWFASDDKTTPFRYMCGALFNDDNDSLFDIVGTWLFANLACEWSYNHLIELGWKPEQARRILPMDIKSPLVMTAFVSDWEHFFELRCDEHAHPQARELAVPLREEFKRRGLL